MLITQVFLEQVDLVENRKERWCRGGGHETQAYSTHHNRRGLGHDWLLQQHPIFNAEGYREGSQTGVLAVKTLS